MRDMEHLLDNYYTWLRDKTVCRTMDQWAEITTPYLDRNNDYMQIYLQRQENEFLLTDDGATIGGLIEEGCALDSSRRRKLLQITLNGYGISRNDNALQVKANQDNFALRKHNLVQAMLAVNDMFYLATPHVVSLFFEEVRNWLEDSKIRFSPDIRFEGKSGFTRKFDFVIPKSEHSPERIIKTINKPDKSSADAVIMDWLDTKERRPQESLAFVVANDNERKISNNFADALQNYDITPVFWSKREEAREKLAA